jgi:hypothetical protein
MLDREARKEAETCPFGCKVPGSEEDAKEDAVHFMLKCTTCEQLRRNLLGGLTQSDWNSAQVDWANMSLQQKAAAMLGFGEEPIPDAEFNNALKFVRDAYKKRG